MGLPDIDNIPDTGAVFTIGRSRFADNVASHFFIRKDPVVSVTCGDEHSAVVCQSGRLFVFGSNDWGQLGLGHKNHVSKPSCVKVLKPERVTHVACGRAHTLICTAEQKIFAFGSDQESQLGRGNHAIGDSSSTPVMIHDCGVDGPKILQIAAGSHHSLVLTSDGEVLAWGSNLEGQLGLPGTSGLVNKPTKVHIPAPVKQISAGYYHSAFLTDTGDVYVCGEAESGKLGIPLDFMTQVAPKQMQLSGPAAFVSCGGHHTIILGDDENIYCTGSNASGQLAMGTEVTELTEPKLLPRGALEGETIKKIACGESHIAIVTDSGNLYTCGDGRHGKLGLEENENNVHELTLATKYDELVVTGVACGGCHTILVGRRRETNNEAADNQQHDQSSLQMKNPLPPLKIPVARIPSANSASTDELSQENDNDDNKKSSPIATTPSTETIVNGTKESIDNIDKPEPKKLSDYLEQTDTKLLPNVDDVNEDHTLTSKNNNKESPTKLSNEATVIDADNNMAIEGNDEKSKRSASSRCSGSAVSRRTTENDEKSEISNDKNKVVEKPEFPPLPVPPPKPPRQKIGSDDNSQSSRRGSSSSRLGSAGSQTTNVRTNVESTIEKSMREEISRASEFIEKFEEDKTRSDGESIGKSVSSGKSRSAKSKAATDETAEADRVDEIVDDEPMEVKTDVAADDVDVVHPVASKTGKISKLFKTKKQELENGTKASNTTNTKAKSKTCVIL